MKQTVKPHQFLLLLFILFVMHSYLSPDTHLYQGSSALCTYWHSIMKDLWLILTFTHAHRHLHVRTFRKDIFGLLHAGEFPVCHKSTTREALLDFSQHLHEENV